MSDILIGIDRNVLVFRSLISVNGEVRRILAIRNVMRVIRVRDETTIGTLKRAKEAVDALVKGQPIIIERRNETDAEWAMFYFLLNNAGLSTLAGERPIPTYI